MTAVDSRRAGAVVARRTELRLRRRQLAPGPRADVAGVLAAARLACGEQLTADLGRVRDAALARVDRACPRELAAVRRDLPDQLAAAGERLDRAFDDRTGPELRRLAARTCPGAPLLPPAGPDRTAAGALRSSCPPVRRGRTAVTDPRLVGALAGLPVLAAHGIGPAAASVAAGVVLLAGCLARARAVDGERARTAEHVTRAVALAGAAGERATARRAMRTEAAVVTALDRAAGERRERVARELAALDAAGV